MKNFFFWLSLVLFVFNVAASIFGLLQGDIVSALFSGIVAVLCFLSAKLQIE